MSEQPFDPSSVSPPSVPPTQAGPLPTATPQSTWPTAIGVIAIVFGAGGILAAVFGILWMVVILPKLLESGPQEQAAMLEVSREHFGLLVTQNLVGLVLAAILLTGGIGLAKRCIWGVKTCRVWAMLKIVLVLFGVGLGYVIQQKVFEAMSPQASGGTNPAFNAGYSVGFKLGSVCFGLVWGIALPVFMLIWFSRARIKAEINGWKVDAGNPYRQGVR